MARLLDALGNQIWSDKPLNGWLGSFNIRHTAADAAGSFVVAVTNPAGSGKYLYIRRVKGRMVFDGTAAAATSLVYELVRYSIPAGATPNPTTGTTLTRTLKDSRMTATVIVDANAQYKSGVLTLAGLTLIESLHFIRIPASVTGSLTEFDVDIVKIDKVYENIVIAPNQGLGMRLTNAAIIGQGISGFVEADERAN